MDKAKIYVLDDQGNEIRDKTMEVMFNPGDYATSINVTWAEGKEGAVPEFKGSNFDKFTVTLLFDTYEKRADVREDHMDHVGGENKRIPGTRRIAELAVPSVEGRETKKPPVCLFSWGKFNFKGVVEKIDQKFTMFLSEGIPVRANVTITMKPILNVQEMMMQKGIEACRKVRTVKGGERLDLIAYQELKNPFLWRRIAEANNIIDPFNFPKAKDIGKVLVIPD